MAYVGNDPDRNKGLRCCLLPPMLARRHGGPALLRDVDVEEVAQETWKRVFQYREPTAPFTIWLCACLRQQILENKCQRTARRIGWGISTYLLSSRFDPAEQVIEKEQVERIKD